MPVALSDTIFITGNKLGLCVLFVSNLFEELTVSSTGGAMRTQGYGAPIYLARYGFIFG